jgi:hypothetical protein
VELIEGEETVASRSLSIAANGPRQTTFGRTFDTPGEYDLFVTDVFVATVTVRRSAATVTQTPGEEEREAAGGEDGSTRTATTTGSDTGISIPGFRLVHALLAVAVVTLFGRWRGS